MLSLAGMSRIAPLAGAPVETLELARPIESSTTFLPDPSTSSCQVTPDVLNRAGTPIALRITTNDQGGVENVLVNQSSGSPEYDQLAVCLVQEQWRFQAATALNAGETQRQPIASDELQITITINRN
jgi:TonB family protein